MSHEINLEKYEIRTDLIDEVIELDRASRENKTRADYLRGQRNSISKSIGMLMANKKIEEANFLYSR